MRSHSTTSPLMRLSLMPEVRMSTRANRNRAASAPAANASASTTIKMISVVPNRIAVSPLFGRDTQPVISYPVLFPWNP